MGIKRYFQMNLLYPRTCPVCGNPIPFNRTYCSCSDEDAQKITEGFRDTNDWKEIVVGDMVLRENSIVMSTHNGEKDVVLEKWPDSDCVYLTIINDISDSFVGGQRMKVARYEIDGDVLNLYDEESLCAVMRIRRGC